MPLSSKTQIHRYEIRSLLGAGGIQRIVCRCLAKDPNERYQSMKDE